MSSLLVSKESQEAKNEGKLVADGYVLERLLTEMLKPEYQTGVIVDGFARSLMQADFVRLLHAKMKDLRQEYGRPFRRPVFRVAVLWVPEAVAVQRQLSRGQEAKALNAQREELGLPLVEEERATDFSVEKATERYATFKDNYEVIQELQKSFHFSVIDATPSKSAVAKALVEEFRYQSSLELGSETLNMIDHIPTVSSISLHARQLLVKRLDTYSLEHPGMLSEAVFIIEKHLVPAIRRASISGKAVVRIQEKLMESNPVLIDMILDVLSDRGFHAYVEQITKSVPEKVDLNTGKVTVGTKIQFRFQVEFTKSIIRQALHKTHRSSYKERKD
jgi:adenylate kinase